MVTVALDIGHGSNTFPPSKGVYKGGKGYAEHDFNAKLVKAIKPILKRHKIKTIVYQKPNKPDIHLTKRTNYYNSKGVDLVYSIHANYNGSPSVNGRCAFYWHTSSQSKKLAKIVVDEIKKAGYSLHGDGLHASKRGSWTNLHICRETRMPAVLVENGFMSGNKDFNLVFGSKQSKYIKDMAEVHAKAICRYFGIKYKGKKGDLTMSQYKKLKKLIDKQNKDITSLKKQLKKKVNEPANGGPSNSHKEGWKFLTNNGISKGKNPYHYMTREQFATMLNRYDNKRFVKGGEVDSSHEKAWEWLVNEGITNGDNPHMYLTREQFATLLYKYHDKFAKKEVTEFHEDGKEVAKHIYPD